jgi:hypothetical protein
MRGLASVVLLLLLTNTAFAQSAPQDAQDDRTNGFSVGWDISSFSNNYGFGVRVDTPRFANGKVHVQLAGNFAWVQGVPVDSTDTTWAPYTLIRVGIIRSSPIRNLPLRFYGGGGVALILPTNKVSEKSAQGGGYGVTGLELAMPENENVRWFVELGGMGTGAKADRLATSPIYANGFIIGWGFRYDM